MNRLPDDLLRRADSELAGHVPNQFMRHILDLASSGIPMVQVLRYVESVYSWHKMSTSGILIPSRSTSSATASSAVSSRSNTGQWPSSSATSGSFNSSQDSFRWPTILEESPPSAEESAVFQSEGQYANRPSKTWLCKLNPAPDPCGPLRKKSCTSDTQCSGNSTKVYTCPWCQQGSARQGEAKKHFQNYCGSESVYICGKCGTGSQTKRHAERLLRLTGSCKPHSLQQFTLQYPRRGFSCPGCGSVSTNLEDHSKHFVDCCRHLGITGPEQRCRQIRGLLKSEHLIHRVESLWHRLGLVEKVGSIDELSWRFEKEGACGAARTVERLEYGERNVAEGEPNFGITSGRIDGYLANLIIDGLPPGSIPQPSSSESGPSRSQRFKQPSMPVPPSAHGTGTSPLFDTMRCESPTPLQGDEISGDSNYTSQNQGVPLQSHSVPSEAPKSPSYGQLCTGNQYVDRNQDSYHTQNPLREPSYPNLQNLPQPDYQMTDYNNMILTSSPWNFGWSGDIGTGIASPMYASNGVHLDTRDGEVL